jgi:hypothetical protein
MPGSDNIIQLDAVKQQAALPDEVPEFIKPRGIADMTDIDADMYMASLRDRRLKAAQQVSEAKQAKARVDNLNNRQKLERKIAQVERADIKAKEAVEKLEDLLIQMRTMVIQYE